MLKLTTDHSIYEIWCEHAAQSVFIDHKPNKDELEIIRKKQWPGTNQWGENHKLEVFKLKPLYTTKVLYPYA